jgi:hypothetical protein
MDFPLMLLDFIYGLTECNICHHRIPYSIASDQGACSTAHFTAKEEDETARAQWNAHWSHHGPHYPKAKRMKE